VLFNTRKIPELAELTYTQRMQVLALAKSKLSLPKKALLNIMKFMLIAPVFLLIATEKSWSVLSWVILLFFLYPLITKPLTILFVRRDLTGCVEEIKRH